ncbi:MAG: hypothetical protein O3A55_00735 [Bacteroidetes bacterium]|nr:hypothetical protein [Bacteroidota bacterium]
MANSNQNILDDRRYVYSEHNSKVEKISDENSESKNRPVYKRKHSTFNIVSWMFVFAVTALLYIGNVIKVESLAKEVGELKTTHKKNRNINQLLQAEINRKSSIEKISVVASNLLQMSNPNSSPNWFSIDRNKLKELKK